MSRVGKKAIEIPKNVSIKIEDGKISVKGQHGTLEKEVSNILLITLENNKIIIQRTNETKACRSYHGLMRALIQNMVTGVDQLYTKTLVAEGVGYKFQIDKKSLFVNVGFTHPVEFVIPENITMKLEGTTRLIISGIDKEKVGFLAAIIRQKRPPEPYKGKGLLYAGEIVRRKAGKTGK